MAIWEVGFWVPFSFPELDDDFSKSREDLLSAKMASATTKLPASCLHANLVSPEKYSDIFVVMEEFFHHLIGSSSHHLQGFIHPIQTVVSLISEPSAVCPAIWTRFLLPPGQRQGRFLHTFNCVFPMLGESGIQFDIDKTAG